MVGSIVLHCLFGVAIRIAVPAAIGTTVIGTNVATIKAATPWSLAFVLEFTELNSICSAKHIQRGASARPYAILWPETIVSAGLNWNVVISSNPA